LEGELAKTPKGVSSEKKNHNSHHATSKWQGGVGGGRVVELDVRVYRIRGVSQKGGKDLGSGVNRKGV